MTVDETRMDHKVQLFKMLGEHFDDIDVQQPNTEDHYDAEGRLLAVREEDADGIGTLTVHDPSQQWGAGVVFIGGPDTA